MSFTNEFKKLHNFVKGDSYIILDNSKKDGIKWHIANYTDDYVRHHAKWSVDHHLYRRQTNVCPHKGMFVYEKLNVIVLLETTQDSDDNLVCTIGIIGDKDAMSSYLSLVYDLQDDSLGYRYFVSEGSTWVSECLKHRVNAVTLVGQQWFDKVYKDFEAFHGQEDDEKKFGLKSSRVVAYFDDGQSGVQETLFDMCDKAKKKNKRFYYTYIIDMAGEGSVEELLTQVPPGSLVYLDNFECAVPIDHYGEQMKNSVDVALRRYCKRLLMRSHEIYVILGISNRRDIFKEALGRIPHVDKLFDFVEESKVDEKAALELVGLTPFKKSIVPKGMPPNLLLKTLVQKRKKFDGMDHKEVKEELRLVERSKRRCKKAVSSNQMY